MVEGCSQKFPLMMKASAFTCPEFIKYKEMLFQKSSTSQDSTSADSEKTNVAGSE